MKEKIYKFNILFLKIRMKMFNILSLMNIMIFPIYILTRLMTMSVRKEIPPDFFYSQYAIDGFAFALFMYLHVVADKMKNIIWSCLFTVAGTLFYANLCARYNMYGEFFNSFFLIFTFLIGIISMIEKEEYVKPKRIKKSKFTFYSYLGYCIVFITFTKLLSMFYDFEGSLFPAYEAVAGVAIVCAIILSSKGYNVRWLFWSIRNIFCVYFWNFIDYRLPIDDTFIFLIINSLLELIIYLISTVLFGLILLFNLW